LHKWLWKYSTQEKNLVALIGNLVDLPVCLFENGIRILEELPDD